MESERTNQMTAMGRMAALHIAFWQYDPLYRRAWLAWPQAIAILLAGWLLSALSVLKQQLLRRATGQSPPIAATRRPRAARQPGARCIIWTKRSADPRSPIRSRSSSTARPFEIPTADDQRKLAAALGAYYRFDWAKAIDILKSATATDPNVQFITALALLIPKFDRPGAQRAGVAARGGGGEDIVWPAACSDALLFAGAGGLPKDEAAGRKLIDDAVTAGEPYAMRLAAAGYVSGEFGGTYDTVKAVDLLRRAADRGEIIAMAQLADAYNTGRGGLARDDAKTVDYLRRAADAGFEGSQITLGRWIRDRYLNRESEDVQESVKLYERSYRQGHSIFAVSELAYLYRYGRGAPWFDTKRSFELLQLCAPYRNGFCLYWLARAYHDGAGTARDYTKAYAYYTVARDLGWRDAGNNLQKLDEFLQPDVKTSAAELAKSISAGLKPVPRTIRLETAETETAGPSPWDPPAPRPATPPPLVTPRPSSPWPDPTPKP